MPCLSENERNRIIGHLQVWPSISIVARLFNMRRGTVYDVIRHYQPTGSATDRPRSGRPRIMTPVRHWYICMTHLCNRFQTARCTANTLPGPHWISATPSWGISVMQGSMLIIVFSIQDLHRATSKHVCSGQVSVQWTWRQWASVMFSDKSRFLLERHDGHAWVDRRRNEWYVPVCVQEAVTLGCRSVLVWGGIAEIFCINLIHIHGNRMADQYTVLMRSSWNMCCLPFQQHGPEIIFMHNNVPAHRDIRTRNIFVNANCNAMTPWPTISPDWNPIAHLWDIIDRRICTLPKQPQTLDERQHLGVPIWAWIDSMVRT